MTTYYKRHQWVFDVLLVAAFLLWCAPSDAQDLPAVAAAGSGYWPLVIIVLIGAGVAGFVIWHKRNPSKADAALHSVVSDAQAIASKAVDAAHGLQQTVAQQAAVIASPPVQSVINAQPAAPILPTTVPLAAAAPAVPTMPPNPPYPAIPTHPPYPATHNWGDWRDVQEGESPGAYWNRTHLGGYGRTTAELAQLAAAAQPQSVTDDANRQYNGPVAISALTDDDKRFLLYAQENYTMPQGLFFAVLNGKRYEINAVIGWADAHRWGAGSPEAVAYNGPMRGYVDAFARGVLKESPA